MTFWSGEKLAQNSQVISPFVPAQIDCNAYTLRMGTSFYRTAERETAHEQKTTVLSPGESFLIPPGQFAFLLSEESVDVPNGVMAFISMRTSIKFQGLINISGFHVDPGYKGKLVYSVYNASPSPIQIKAGDPIFKIWFAEMDQDSNTPYVFAGRGLTQIGNELTKGMNHEILSLQSVAKKIRDLETDINTKFAEQKPTIDTLFFIWRAVSLAIIGAATLALFSLAYPSFEPLGQLFKNYWTEKIKPNQTVPKTNPSPAGGSTQ